MSYIGLYNQGNGGGSGGSGSGVTAEQVQQSAFNRGVDSGVADAYVVVLDPPATGGALGMGVQALMFNANTTTTPTLDIGFGPIGIVLPNNQPLAPGDIGDSQTSFFLYSIISGWVLLNPLVSTVTASYIQQQKYTYAGVDTGITNAYVITVTPLFTSYLDGMSFWFIPANTNTSSGCTLDAGPNPINIVGPNANALNPGDIVAGSPANVIYYNGLFFLQNPASSVTQEFAGNPNTNVGGEKNNFCIDTTNNFLYYCSTAGNSATAVWTKIVM